MYVYPFWISTCNNGRCISLLKNSGGRDVRCDGEEMRVKCILSRLLLLVLDVVEESEIGDDWTLILGLDLFVEGSCAADGDG